MLKACHKRCAERTLKVLEKNGGIFIKLGQHLVRPLRCDFKLAQNLTKTSRVP
jgi:predicted unusual protein kinase regulating ubiquinone biosynthesis (AarF/ABC1/UbiB family)